MPINGRFIRVFMSLVAVVPLARPVMATQKPPLDRAIQRQQQRDQFIGFEAVIDTLGIAPGMTILDIGAGPGSASFLFAERLHGTGEVFATDIREDFVNHIADEARRRGLTNLSSVLVKADGLDDFYGKHRYDLVFLSNVYHALDGRIEYFSRLRELLSRDGRLALILYNQTPLFSVEDLANFNALVNSLLINKPSPADDDPFLNNLSPATRKLLKDDTRREELKHALVNDFNRILVDPRFYRNYYSDSYFRKGLFTPPERDLANWLLMSIKEEGIEDSPVDRIDARVIRTVIKLNRLFFIKRFGNNLAGLGMGAYTASGDANRHTSKYVVQRELAAAGYQLVSESRLSPYFDLVIMTRKTPSAQADTAAVRLPRTGQSTCYKADGAVIPCARSGQDGELQAGAAWPSPRFIDNGNGTVTDKLTGLIWLKEANCTDTVGGVERSDGLLGWVSALAWSSGLANGKCGLSDNSVAGDWRLPNIVELRSLIDYSRYDPALSDGHPFGNVRLNWYWSSTTNPITTTGAYNVGLGRGSIHVTVKYPAQYGASRVGDKGEVPLGVWPVRGGK